MRRAAGRRLPRRGFVDGRGCRPSVAVRAGAPNAATTSCFSVVREPPACALTTRPSPPTSATRSSGRTAVAALLAMHDAPAAQADAVLGFDRTVFVPSIAVTLPTSRRHPPVVAPEHGALGAVTAPDAALSAAVALPRADRLRPRALGIRADSRRVDRRIRRGLSGALAKDIRLAEVPLTALKPRPAGGGARGGARDGGGSGIGQAVAVRRRRAAGRTLRASP